MGITIILVLLAIILIGLLIKFIKSKNYKAIIILISVILIIGLSYYLYSENKEYKIIDSGYISNFNNIIISNVNDYNEFMRDSNEGDKEYKQKISSSKYNEKYFEDKSLALVFITTGNSANKLTGVDLSTNNNTLLVKPNIDYAEAIMTDITGKLVLVEIDKNITQIEVER